MTKLQKAALIFFLGIPAAGLWLCMMGILLDMLKHTHMILTK